MPFINPTLSGLFFHLNYWVFRLIALASRLAAIGVGDELVITTA